MGSFLRPRAKELLIGTIEKARVCGGPIVGKDDVVQTGPSVVHLEPLAIKVGVRSLIDRVRDNPRLKEVLAGDGGCGARDHRQKSKVYS